MIFSHADMIHVALYYAYAESRGRAYKSVERSWDVSRHLAQQA